MTVAAQAMRELSLEEVGLVSGGTTLQQTTEEAAGIGTAMKIGTSIYGAFAKASGLELGALESLPVGIAAIETEAAVMQYGETKSEVQYVLDNIHNDPAPPATDSTANYVTIDGHYFDTSQPGNQGLTLNTTSDGVTYLSNSQGDQLAISHTPDTTVTATADQIPTESATLDLTLTPVASDAATPPSTTVAATADPIPTEPAAVPNTLTQTDSSSGIGGGDEEYWSSHGDYMDGSFGD